MTAPVISVVVPGPAELAEAAASWTGERITGAVATRGACYLALAGGETPRGCYERLGLPPYRDSIPWKSVFVYWSDERQVPLDDPGSNYAKAKAALLHHAPKPPPERLTLTLPVLNAARAVLFMVQGASKWEAVARVLRRDRALPASQVQPLDGELAFIVDRAAAGQ